MPYKKRTEIAVPPETKAEIQDAKEELGISYREFLEKAARELRD